MVTKRESEPERVLKVTHSKGERMNGSIIAEICWLTFCWIYPACFNARLHEMSMKKYQP